MGKTFIVEEATRQELKQECRRRSMSEDSVDYYVDGGIWYRFARVKGGNAIYEECPEEDVPEHERNMARQHYPGALNS